MARNALVEIEQGSLIHCNRMVSLGRRDPGCIRIPHGTNVRGGVWRPIPSRSHLLSHLATSACRSLRFLPWIVAAGVFVSYHGSLLLHKRTVLLFPFAGIGILLYMLQYLTCVPWIQCVAP